MGSVTSGYQISRSVRSRSSASASFSRTFGTPTNNKIFTWSAWIKRGSIGTATRQSLFSYINSGNTTYFGIEFNPSDGISIWDSNATTANASLVTTQVFRDPSAWYHIVMQVDMTQATASNRIRLYVNGVQVTSFSTNTIAAQNSSPYMNNTGLLTYLVGSWLPVSGLYFDGYSAEVNFIDGQALTPSSFGSVDTNGIWQPKAYSGTYGTNGFYLKFTDNSASTATTIGKDYSGNGNNWTPNNVSVTAGITNDSLTDTLTNNSFSAANFCVWNPVNKGANMNITAGNLNSNGATTAYCGALGTIGMSSGKWYWEGTINTLNATYNTGIGVGNASTTLAGRAAYTDTNFCYLDATDTAGATNYAIFGNGNSYVAAGLGASAVNDVVMVAYDAATGKLWLGAKGTWYNSGNPAAGTNPTTTLSTTTAPYFPYALSYASSGFSINFGQRAFTYTVPTGFSNLNTYNLPVATITNGATVMAASTYTGTGATQSIVNSGNNAAAVAFQPDLVWIKSRSAATDHKLTNSVRGATKALVSDSTAAETTDTNGLTAFVSNGFTLGTDTNYNNSAATYIGWQWQAGQGSTSSNTSGSITSTVSVNPSAGFSIVTYTGTGANATVGHGLGVAPKMVIVKSRSNGTANWTVYHVSTGPTGEMILNTSAAFATVAADWNNTSPTSSVFSLGSAASVNQNGATFVAYCWSEVTGYSKFGSYTGNGSSDGPFIYCGFRPRWIMIKRTDTTGGWTIWDTSRDPYNIAGNELQANTANTEATAQSDFDILSNGIKMRNTYAAENASGGTYIYAAFAENPFNISRAR